MRGRTSFRSKKESIHEYRQQHSPSEHNKVKRVKGLSQHGYSECLQYLGGGRDAEDQHGLHSPVSQEANMRIVQAQEEVHGEGNNDIREVAVVEREQRTVEVGSQPENVNQRNEQQNTDCRRNPASGSSVVWNWRGRPLDSPALYHLFYHFIVLYHIIWGILTKESLDIHTAHCPLADRLR